jgi:hypothetical protein
MKLQDRVTKKTLTAVLMCCSFSAVIAIALNLLTSNPVFGQPNINLWPTYHQNIKPILEKHCTACHFDGGIAPFALNDEQQVTKLAAQVLDAVKNRRMPPWMPGSDSLRFLNERKLSLEEGADITNWVRGGVQPGFPEPQAISSVSVTPQKPDVTLAMPVYTPVSQSKDDYRCFLFDPGNIEDRLVTRYRINPGEASEVHHVIIFKLDGNDAKKAVELDQRTGGKGWGCFGGPNIPDSPQAGGNWLGAWVPGTSEVASNPGTGIPLPTGTKLVFQVHYNLPSNPKPDRTSLELFYAPVGAKLKPIYSDLLWAPVELPCAKGINLASCDRDTAIQNNLRKYGFITSQIPNFLLHDCRKSVLDYTNPGDLGNIETWCENTINPLDRFLLYGLAGHMHLRGRSISLELNPGRPNAKMLLHIPKWDFHWQGYYQLETPIMLEPGDTLRLTCHHDNSSNLGVSNAEARYIVWGEGTEDEMCLGVIAIGPA